MALGQAHEFDTENGSIGDEVDVPPSRGMRDSMRRFAAGVTVVATRDAEGLPVGLTVSSFNTVSLDPPLVLWSLSRRARSLSAFVRASHFAVSVLGAHQIELAERFAAPVAERFADVEWRCGQHGTPVLDDVAAWFECRNAFQHDGGDHLIFVGEVVHFGHLDHPPLIALGGSYCLSAPHPARCR